MNTLSICRTCPRDGPDTGKFGQAMREALGAELAAESIEVMMVHCLGGCRKPGNLAFDSPDKVRIRLSDISLQDAEWIIVTARQYIHADGPSASIAVVPSALQCKVTALAPKLTHGRR